jgi:membrane associated rhomboid family serine protease
MDEGPVHDPRQAPLSPMRASRLFNVPPVVGATAAALAAIFVLTAVAPRAVLWLTAGSPGLSPVKLFAGPSASGGVIGWLSPLFTHMLMHANLAHLLFNGLWLLVFGTPVARRFHDPFRFLAFFALCGAAGGIFFSAFHASDPTILVGASGGVTGLLGGVVRFAFQNPLREYRRTLPLFDRSVLTWSALVILLNASVAIAGPGFGASGADVAWQAHIGGYLFGLIAFPLFDRRA